MNREGPELEPVDGQDEVGDDAVIARALRWSVAVVAAAVALVFIGLYVTDRPEIQPAVREAPLEGPQAAAGPGAGPPAVHFRDVTVAAGVDFVHVNGAYGDRLLPETMGGGVAFLDYDDDGNQDLLLVNSAHWPWRGGPPVEGAWLYRNRGDGRFEKVSAGPGLERSLYGMGAAAADYDGDGRVDLFLSALGPNRLLRNEGGGRFEDVTAFAGVAGDGDAWSSSAAFFDYDRDGDVDLFVANYVRWSREIDFEVDYRLAGIGRAYGPPANYRGTNSYLYRNEGNGRFSDVSAEAGLQVANPATGAPMGKGLGVLPLDVNEDGWLDVVVANDTVRNFLFHNRGDGSFEELGASTGLAYDNAGSATGAMGIDAARYDDDGALVVAIGNFANEMTSFYVAEAGVDLFTDEAIVAGIGPASRRALSFGLFFFDYDLDGRTDLLQANGHVENDINLVQPSQRYEQPAQLFWNCGTECARRFVSVPEMALGDLAQPLVGRGAAYADIDRDGDLDVVITQVGRAPMLLRNEQTLGHHWLRVRLRQGGLNRDAIGARLALHAGGRAQRRWVMPGRSYLSQVELPVTFGLGATATIDSLVLEWPDGTRQEVRDLAVDTEHTIVRSPDLGAGNIQ